MDADQIGALFTRGDGSYLCARWGRPIVPVVFGVDDATLGVIKGAVEAVVALAGHRIDETDPELGANLMLFFVRDWDELRGVPGLDRLIEGLPALLDRLEAAEANQYRVFRFDAAGAIKACFVFVRMDAHLSDLPAETLALSQAVQAVLSWSERAFAGASPLGMLEGAAVLKPDIAGVIRAAYNPMMPVVARDASHALRLAARISLPEERE
ncbi:hypothetical protein [Pseudotabrizicola alkalilacus]|uniref:Uncharacterized protein n=1 Tax=Pseudotabrizicola alkalilacus TaxID=2305252 RepID=A0A411Z5W0_9RHOB|nr:hypothetical protein [Pseudotabrizicola alkalilacus]RGP38468.1 hypothetical protein D1012_06580 [Pseudotabrizicola alkalilacus]